MLFEMRTPISLSSLLCFVLLIPCGILNAQTDSLKANQLYQQGKEMYYDGEYQDAVKTFQKALSIQQGLFPEKSEPVMKTMYRLGSAHRKMRQHPEALDWYTRGLAIAEEIKGAKSEDAIDFLWGIGATKSQMYDPKGAIAYYEKCLDAYIDLFGRESSEVGNMYMNIASSLHRMTNYYEAERYYKEAFSIFQKSSKPTSVDFNRIYSNMGYLYRKMGDYERALEFGQKALEIKLLNYKKDHPSVGKYYRNIGKAYQGMGAFEQALPFMEKCLRNQVKALGNKHAETGGAYGEFGSALADLERYDEALKFYFKALKILEAALEPTHPYLVGGYCNIGLVYQEMGQYDQAISWYQKALDKFRDRIYQPTNLIAEAQRRVAYVLFDQGKLDSALVLIQESLGEIDPTFKPTDIYEHPEQVESIQDKVSLIPLLETKGLFLADRFEETGTQKDLEQAYQSFLLAIRVIEQLRKSYQSDEARQLLSSESTPIFIKAIQLAYDLYERTGEIDYLWQAFEISEQSKASILWRHVSENIALQSSAVPADILTQIAHLEGEIERLEEEQFEEERSPEEQSNITGQLFDQKQKYEQLIATIEQQNPRYFELKYQSPKVGLKTIQQSLSEGEGILEYFHSEEHIYIFLITPNNFVGARQSAENTYAEIASIRENNNQVDLILNKEASDQQRSALAALYQTLIAPIKETIVPLDQLIIIPHGYLQFLPFEMLSERLADDFRSMPYLLHTHQIQYAWSIPFWMQETPKNQTFSTSFVGFAPSFDQSQEALMAYVSRSFSDALPALTNTREEVQRANDYFQGSIWLDTQASEDQFKAVAHESQIVHLATHAFADNTQPLKSGLAFAPDSLEDGFLHAYEIYNMDIPADLAVMSACNTGYGKISEGEGVMSLGRAFAYAGCQSILMSLWPANDQSTATLMDAFYGYLSSGYTKDQALRQAKLDYLDQADPLTAHPYFWANMVAVGDMRPLSSPSPSLSYVWAPLGLLFAVFLFFILGKRKRSSTF